MGNAVGKNTCWLAGCRSNWVRKSGLDREWISFIVLIECTLFRFYSGVLAACCFFFFAACCHFAVALAAVLISNTNTLANAHTRHTVTWNWRPRSRKGQKQTRLLKTQHRTRESRSLKSQNQNQKPKQNNSCWLHMHFAFAFAVAAERRVLGSKQLKTTRNNTKHHEKTSHTCCRMPNAKCRITDSFEWSRVTEVTASLRGLIFYRSRPIARAPSAGNRFANQFRITERHTVSIVVILNNR